MRSRVLHSAAGGVEQSLVEGCRSGDRAALDRLFREHVRIVEGVLARLVGPSPDLEDLVQTTFLEALRSLPRYRGEASLSTWVTRIGVHVAYHHLRRGARRAAPLELVADRLPDGAPDPGTRLDDRRARARLYQLLDRIKPKKRIALLLYVVAEHSVEEVAALTGASRTAVKSRLFFARRELAALVKHDPMLRAFAETYLPSEVA
jgi:RNA polymerase sigma-70 factor (ECF subfamily)